MDEAASLARARLQLGQRQLRATEQYRHEHRQERLTRLLQGSAQLTRYIYPHYGSVEFVELPFRNPYSTEHAFTVVRARARARARVRARVRDRVRVRVRVRPKA